MAHSWPTPLVRLVFLAGMVTAQATSTATNDPIATSNPTLIQQAYGYDPSIPAAGIFTGLYAVTAFVLFLRLYSNRTWWGLCLPVGAAGMAIGFALRIPMTLYPNSETLYLSSLLFILLSPAAFLAFDYILYGRFLVNCMLRHYSMIRPERTARYFIISDITTILVQGAGGSLLGSTDPNTVNTGVYIVIVGLGLQTLSYGLYILLVYHVFWGLKREGIKPFQEPWAMIFKTLFFTSALFLLRCIYRTVELAQGLGNGYLMDHEVFFYVLDALPLLGGICTYVVYWPSRYLYPSDGISSLTPIETRENDV